ncbi:MAG: hypothetical protein K2N79_03775 [Muribaculaceae bacterium]|nr:hypothetical protein [Muribaculaceae bacterium]
MKIIAESSSTRTHWTLVDGTEVIAKATTAGLNPYFQSRREISHSIRLELPEAFFRRRWDHVYYYGAGCANIEKCKIMESSLVAQFKTPVTVESDLLGAARGLLVREPGLACIIGTGSNSCVYDGEHIVSNVRPLGYVLGDEGSGCYIGKLFVSDCLKGLAPEKISAKFFEEYNIRTDAVMDAIYTAPLAGVLLSSYSNFLAHHLDNEYVDKLIYDAFTQFFKRNIAPYNYPGKSISVVGAVACRFDKIFIRAANDFGIEVDKIVPASMPGLIEFHAKDL